MPQNYQKKKIKIPSSLIKLKSYLKILCNIKKEIIQKIGTT